MIILTCLLRALMQYLTALDYTNFVDTLSKTFRLMSQNSSSSVVTGCELCVRWGRFFSSPLYLHRLWDTPSLVLGTSPRMYSWPHTSSNAATGDNLSFM